MSAETQHLFPYGDWRNMLSADQLQEYYDQLDKMDQLKKRNDALRKTQ